MHGGNVAQTWTAWNVPRMFVMSAACREVAVQADVRELLPALIAAVCHSN